MSAWSTHEYTEREKMTSRKKRREEANSKRRERKRKGINFNREPSWYGTVNWFGINTQDEEQDEGEKLKNVKDSPLKNMEILITGS